jgi:hypothetical protein
MSLVLAILVFWLIYDIKGWEFQSGLVLAWVIQEVVRATQ